MSISTSDSSQGEIFSIRKLNCVASWAWNQGGTENCAICKNQIMEKCIECQANTSDVTDDCSVAWGSCEHAFHHHCIAKWLQTRMVCPLDSKTWEYKRLGN